MPNYRFSFGSSERSQPSRDARAVTPSDDDELPYIARAISLQVAGNLKITTPEGRDEVLPLPAGMFPIEATKIFETGTTATGIVAYY